MCFIKILMLSNALKKLYLKKTSSDQNLNLKKNYQRLKSAVLVQKSVGIL